MSQNLERLKSIIYGGEYDQESIEEIKRLEERLEQAVIDQKLLQISAVQDYVIYLEEEINRCKEALAEQIDLTEKQRIQLHERKQACRDFIRFFKPTKQVESQIKHYLDLNAPKTESNFE